MRTELPVSHVRVAAGSSVSVEVDITNTADVIDGVTVLVDGINPVWVSLERPLVSLFPEASDRLVINFDIPAHCQAGDYLIDLRIVSAVDASREASHDFWLIVEPRVDIDLDIRPSIIRCGRHGTATATVRNTGNCGTEVELTTIEPTREVNAVILPPLLPLGYATETQVEIDLRGRRPWFGEPATRPLVVRAQAGDRVVERNLTFIQRPWIPRGVGTALILTAIVALWAFIFLYVVSALRSGGDPPKAVPIEEVDGQKEIFTGAANIPLRLINGTVEGTVTASTNGEGIPSVTVEAFRIKTFPKVAGEPDPDPPTTIVSVASGATDENGEYSLRTLIPGQYVLRFSDPGYGEVWHPGTLASGQSLSVGVEAVLRNTDIVMTGRLGSVTVQIDLPDGVDPSSLTAQITSRDVATVSGFRSVTAQAGGQCSVGPTGLVTCDGVPTPGEYTITVTGPGFETQRIDVALTGGDDTVVDTVQLAGEPGSIGGTVVDQDGAALVGAEVRISSGQFSARVFADRSGRFTVADLPTPGDYVVDVSLPGYVGRTVAIPLEPGQTLTLPTQQLVGGVGTASGVVVDPDGDPLPGVEVTVTGGGTNAFTATLTDGAPGTFLIRNLDVPGTYSISFSLGGYVTESRLVTFTAAGEQSLGSITMSTGYGEITGSVVDPNGNAVANARVELQDGLRTRTTTTSTSGGGTFSFPSVLPGVYMLVVTSEGTGDDVAMWVAQRTVAAGETVTLDALVLPIGGLGRIEGVVTGLGNERLGQVAITVAPIDGGEVFVTSTPAVGVESGTYQVDGLDVPGSYLVSFSLENYSAVTERVDLAFGNGANFQTLNVAMDPDPGPVSGVVVDSATQPVAGAVVTITAADGTSAAAVTDVTGAFSFVSVAAGNATLDVVAPAPATGATTTSFTVPAGGGDPPAPIVLDVTVPVVATTTTTAAPAAVATTTVPTTVPSTTVPTTGVAP